MIKWFKSIAYIWLAVLTGNEKPLIELTDDSDEGGPNAETGEQEEATGSDIRAGEHYAANGGKQANRDSIAQYHDRQSSRKNPAR